MTQSLTTTNREAVARRAAQLAGELRAMRQALGVETMAAHSPNAETFAMLTLIERFTELVNTLLSQAPPTVIVTNEVKPGPVTVIQTQPRFSTEETIIRRGNNGEMLGSVTRVTHTPVGGE